MAEKLIIVASNRGPSFRRTSTGDLEIQWGQGGLVNAILPALRDRGALWVAAAFGDDDRRIARQGIASVGHLNVRLLDITESTFNGYYNVIANRFLWFLCHHLWGPANAPTIGAEEHAAWDSFVSVNEQFATAIEESAPAGSSVMIQDYHLALVPEMLRARRPDIRIALFWHIPFPLPDYLKFIPGSWSKRLIEGMLGANLVGFHTKRWARSFTETATAVVGSRENHLGLEFAKRTILVRDYPMGIDVTNLQNAAATAQVAEHTSDLESWLGGRRLILRVDRTDPSKNILRGLRAYEQVLRRRNDLRARVVHLALLTPSREVIVEYREYLAECQALAQAICAQFGVEGWEPVRLEVVDDFPRALAAYRLYDVLIVNPVFDGMNLIAREGPTLNNSNGILILSRNAGAWDELRDAAIGVDPFDIGNTSDAIQMALDMQAPKRLAMSGRLRQLAGGLPPDVWLEKQVKDLASAR